jgi:hypothetical protein
MKPIDGEFDHENSRWDPHAQGSYAAIPVRQFGSHDLRARGDPDAIEPTTPLIKAPHLLQAHDQVGLKKQKIGMWRQAAAPNPSYLGTIRSLNMLCGLCRTEAEVAL